MSFSKLPPELICKIVSFTDYNDSFALKKCCRALNEATKKTKYHFQKIVYYTRSEDEVDIQFGDFRIVFEKQDGEENMTLISRYRSQNVIFDPQEELRLDTIEGNFLNVASEFFERIILTGHISCNQFQTNLESTFSGNTNLISSKELKVEVPDTLETTSCTIKWLSSFNMSTLDYMIVQSNFLMNSCSFGDVISLSNLKVLHVNIESDFSDSLLDTLEATDVSLEKCSVTVDGIKRLIEKLIAKKVENRYHFAHNLSRLTEEKRKTFDVNLLVKNLRNVQFIEKKAYIPISSDRFLIVDVSKPDKFLSMWYLYVYCQKGRIIEGLFVKNNN